MCTRRKRSRAAAAHTYTRGSQLTFSVALRLMHSHKWTTPSPSPPPQALRCSELISLDTWAIRPSCTQSRESLGGTDPSSPSHPSCCWLPGVIQSRPGPARLQPSWLPDAGVSRAQCGHTWAHAAHTHCRCYCWPAPSKSKFGNPCTIVKLKKQLEVSECEWDALIHVIWWLCDISTIYFALYKNVPVFACFIRLLFLTDTFSSVASFHLSNDLLECIYLNIWKVFISTDHQSWVPAHMYREQKITKLRIAWYWFQQSV